MFNTGSANSRTSFARAVLIDPHQDARWDEFVANHPLGWLTHLSGWKGVLESSFQHMRGYYLALLDNTGLTIRAALPIFEVDSWLTGVITLQDHKKEAEHEKCS